MNLFSLTGKRALITGAGSGIGAAIARTFAAAGAHVFVADRDAVGGQSVADEIGGTFVTVDVTNETDCDAAARIAEPLDILVNNAGIGHVGTMMQTTGADMDRLYAVNVRGVFNMCKVFLPGMVERKYGVIINLASIGGVVGLRDRIAYATSKFAVVGLTKSMALDHALDGVRMNSICPGRVETPFVQARVKEYPDPEKAYREMAASQPIGRMAKPEEIASAALYLASDESGFVTGSEFIIDGGFSAGK